MDNIEFWDKKARHFQLNMENVNEGEKADVMTYLKKEGMIFDGGKVLDIGCGTGKYAVEFLKENMHVFAVDISPKMLEYASANLKAVGGEFDVFLGDWKDISKLLLDKNEKFDFVFASNSPAVKTLEDIQYMCYLSKKYCFINKFTKRVDTLKNTFSQYLGRDYSSGKKSEYHEIINHIKSLGYIPSCEFSNYKKVGIMSVEEAVEDYIMHQNLDKNEITDSEKTSLLEFAESISDENKTLKNEMITENIWIKWEV